jgi:hypothetical protein
MAARRTTKRTRRGEENGKGPPPFPGAEWADPDEFKAFWGTSPEEMALEDERERAERGNETIISAGEYFAARERGEEPNATVRLYGDDEFLDFVTRLSKPRADV